MAESYDEEQLRLMGEQCILVDTNDKPLGPISKEKCHKTANIRQGMLHRAFSVFLFNSKGELLLQQRAKTKITFPEYWTNTCCSHPLYVEEELEEKENLGVKRAAQRKLEHELGIKKDSIDVDEFCFMTKLHYLADSNDEWGEHEVDHILLAQKDVKFKENPSEVMASRYVTKSELEKLFEQRDLYNKTKEGEKIIITPWFELICRNFLYKWWDDLAKILHNKGPLVSEKLNTIHRLSLDNEKKEDKSDKSELSSEKADTTVKENGHKRDGEKSTKKNAKLSYQHSKETFRKDIRGRNLDKF